MLEEETFSRKIPFLNKLLVHNSTLQIIISSLSNFLSCFCWHCFLARRRSFKGSAATQYQAVKKNIEYHICWSYCCMSVQYLFPCVKVVANSRFNCQTKISKFWKGAWISTLCSSRNLPPSFSHPRVAFHIIPSIKSSWNITSHIISTYNIC